VPLRRLGLVFHRQRMSAIRSYRLRAGRSGSVIASRRVRSRLHGRGCQSGKADVQDEVAEPDMRDAAASPVHNPGQQDDGKDDQSKPCAIAPRSRRARMATRLGLRRRLRRMQTVAYDAAAAPGCGPPPASVTAAHQPPWRRPAGDVHVTGFNEAWATPLTTAPSPTKPDPQSAPPQVRATALTSRPVVTS
jgi:hypothetical protein